MANIEISPDQFGDAINKILLDYAETVAKDSKEAVEETGKMAVKIAQSYASRIGRGKYAKSLSLEKEKDSGRLFMFSSVTIYSKQYRIAHLLEHGHIVKNKAGEVVGTSKAFPHFAPAEAAADSMLESKIKQAIKGA